MSDFDSEDACIEGCIAALLDEVQAQKAKHAKLAKKAAEEAEARAQEAQEDDDEDTQQTGLLVSAMHMISLQSRTKQAPLVPQAPSPAGPAAQQTQQGPTVPAQQTEQPQPQQQAEVEEGEILEMNKIIHGLLKDDKTADTEGPAIDSELVASVEVMCWRTYSESEMDRMMADAVPPSNTRRRHPITVNVCLEDNSPIYARHLRANIHRIHRLTQSSMVLANLLLRYLTRNWWRHFCNQFNWQLQPARARSC